MVNGFIRLTHSCILAVLWTSINEQVYDIFIVIDYQLLISLKFHFPEGK